jgi:hypothetical protein
MGNWLPSGNWVGDESDWWNKGAGGDEGTTNGYDARFVPREGVGRDLYDALIEYDGKIKGSEDSTDLLGPSVGEVTDPLVQTDDEGGKPWWFKFLSDPQAFTGIIIAIGALFLLGPLLELLAAILGGTQ